MSKILSIAGTQVMPAPSLPSQAIFLDRLTLNLDGYDELEWHAFVEALPGTYHPEQAVTLSDVTGGVTTILFQGWIFSRHPDEYGTGPGRVGYRCLGLAYGANLIAVTAADGTGTMGFNRTPIDPYYSATEAGLSVGTIISQVLAQHSSQLSAIGVSTDATTTSQLNALTVVPPDPVYIGGNSLYTQLQQFLMQWYGSRYALYITPAGLIRCYDTYSLTTRTITLDLDPAILTSMTEDTSQSFTRVVLRGRDNVQAAWLTMHDGTLVGEATCIGSGASGTAVLSGGGVASVTIGQGGHYPAGTPTVVFLSNDGGTGATGSAVMSGTAVASVTVGNAGSGYTVPPTVVFLPGGWTAAQQASWTWVDFAYPQNGYDQGQITALTSTVVTVKSDYATATWAANYWNGIQGTISVINPIVQGLGGFQATEHITACSAMAAGGTATITLAAPLSATGYTRYQIVGYPTDGESWVWRKYYPSNEHVAMHMVPQFNYGMPFAIGMGNVSLVTSPVLAIQYTSAGITQITQVPCQVVPSDGTNPGYILANNPVVQFTSTQGQLNAGGSSVVAPSDVYALVPYSLGALTVQSPSGGGYSGSAYSLFGVQRTLYRDYPSWIDAGNTSNMQTLADNILATVDNAIQEGSVTYLGEYTAALPTGSWPIALNIAKRTGTTGYESMNAPVRSVSLSWPQEGATLLATGLNFSTRRQMYSGDRLYVHPMYSSGAVGEQLGGGFGGGGPTFGGVVNAVEVGGEAPTMEFGEAGPNRYGERKRRKKDLKHVDSMAKSFAAAYGGAPESAAPDWGERLDKQAEQLRIADDQKENDRRAQASRDRRRTRDRMVRSGDAYPDIATAHQAAYGKHDPAQDIVDAHQSAYGTPDGEQVASND